MLQPTYPGVYIQEVPSGVRTITGVATSITAFIGRARRGPVDDPVRIQSFIDYERRFGGLWRESTMSYAVQQFFEHGGTDAIIIRVFNGDQAANTAAIALPTGALTLEASSPGDWGNALRAYVDHDTRDPSDANLFNLRIEELEAPGSDTVVSTETFLNVSIVDGAPRDVASVLEQQSTLVWVRGDVNARPDETPNPVNADGTGGNGDPITEAQVTGGSQEDREGLYALEDVDLFNLLCIPPPTRTSDWYDAATDTYQVWDDAATYCQDRRAMLIIDPPAAWTANPVTAISTAVNGVNGLRAFVGNARAINAAVYFPRLRMADPLNENRTRAFAPSGAVAGIIARTDAQRGVWKAPAGLDAALAGLRGFTYKMTDDENGDINPLGLNGLRSFPVNGNVVWGARTLAGADRLGSEWKYIPVRRLALFIEETLYRGTQWVIFEPNDEPLWAQIRLNVGAFMHDLFRKGAFQGSSPREAYFVKCDSDTTTQTDIDRGIVNLLVGFAPLKPAEFLIIQISQIAGQLQT